MARICHRCHAELPRELTTGSAYGGDEDAPLFCPRCGAPQIQLPEYMRAEVASTNPGEGTTTGAVPPPRPQMVDWPVALRCVLPVALVTAVFSVLGVANAGAFFIATLCVLSGSSVVLALYRSRRPLARVSGRVGLRIGLLTGLIMVSITLCGFSVTGVVERYALHGMSKFDEMLEKQQAEQQITSNRIAEQMLGAKFDPQTLEWQSRLITSPEYRAGSMLAGVLIQSIILIALTSALGGFAGLLQTRRRALQRGD